MREPSPQLMVSFMKMLASRAREILVPATLPWTRIWKSSARTAAASAIRVMASSAVRHGRRMSTSPAAPATCTH